MLTRTPEPRGSGPMPGDAVSQGAAQRCLKELGGNPAPGEMAAAMMLL